MKSFHNYSNVATDDTYLENLQHGNAAYPFAYYLEDIWQFDLHCINWHWHPEIEIVYAAQGTALCYAGSDKIQLPCGYGLFVNSGVLHRYEAAESVCFPNIVFSPLLLGDTHSRVYEKYIRPIIHSPIPYQIFNPAVDWHNKILQILKTIFDLQDESAQPELKTIQALYHLWDVLFVHWEGSNTPSMGHYKASQQSKLHIMVQYMHTHFQEQISLDEIAASVSVSKNQALCIFKTSMHISPIAYLIQYRLAHAAKLLSTTEKTISVIAEESGFTSTGYFCRKFKEFYSMTPNQYRLKKQNMDL